MNNLKFLLAKIWVWNILAADDNTATAERLSYFTRAFLVIGPVSYFFEILTDWYLTNEAFVHGNIFLIGINSVLGGIFHFRKGDFSWEELLIKTVKISALSLVVYAVLEIVISRGGDYGLVTAFRSALQVGTLLYPGTKILKNVYILSKGEYPPAWIMRKVYNFQENGDLKDFLSTGVKPPYDSEIEEDFNQKFRDHE